MRASRLPDSIEAMMSADRAEVEARLEKWHERAPRTSPRLHEALGYSLLGAGKRLRAILSLWANDAAGGTRDDAIWSAAMSLEMVHAYSLVHDDLPAMDDDDIRRGQASCHVRFDEATAILAGDALQAEAMALLSEVAEPRLATDLLGLLAQNLGLDGMAAGQQMDLETPDESLAAEPAWQQLRQIHQAKTGRLLGAALAMGARCAGVQGERLKMCSNAGVLAGEAFQIQDDILDATASSEELGKSAGKDAAQGKLTAVRALGNVDVARERATFLLLGALDTLRAAKVESEALSGLLSFFVDRSR